MLQCHLVRVRNPQDRVLLFSFIF
ncbi:hypothetical protein U0070_012636 [Myodes glareolus]|uniref:Uncharacterized protein n=1 Tax=Myodes glareolus TaxID=447135 RepID=A0AAW0JRU8_MYOGA